MRLSMNRKPKTFKLLAAVLSMTLIMSALTGCGAKEEQTTIRIGTLAGPTAMGMVKLMSDSENGETENTYSFSDPVTDASALVTPIAKGELDVAAVPSNLASAIYNSTDGGIEVLSACALGVLYLVERGETVNSMADLAGKKVYATGEGAVPEYTIRYILSYNGIDADSDLEIQWCSDTTEALSYISNDPAAIAILPQPFVTAACAQVEDLRVVQDLNDAWAETDAGSDIVTGVIVARRDFADRHPEQLKKFMEEYSASVEYASTNVEETAELVAKYGIVAKAPIAQKALPQCHIVSITGSDLKTALEGFLQIVYDMNPKAVGGAVPGDDFYYGL